MANKFIAALGDSTLFLREWIVNPQRTGAVAPSSPQLAAAMARWLPRDPESYVLELGPGTGAVTDALLKRGLREDRLVAIEHNPSPNCFANGFRKPTSLPGTPGNWMTCWLICHGRSRVSAR